MGVAHIKCFCKGSRNLFLIGTGLITSLAAKGVVVQEIHSFPSSPIPNSVLVQDAAGAFYGTTSGGGDFGAGTIYRATTNGTIQTLVSFDNTNGGYPNEPLVLGLDGALYGTTIQGGSNNFGTVFRVTTNGILTSLASFNAFTTGANPLFGLIHGADGAFYGTTTFGGLNYTGDGTVFRVTTNGALTTVASFGNLHGTNQYYASPLRVLALGNDGSIYGATTLGGSNNAGMFFRVTTNDTLSILASFGDTNGQKSEISLSAGSNGMFYGTTVSHTSQAGMMYSPGSSSLFQVGTNGDLTTVATYTNDFLFNGGLAQTGNGILYGTASSYGVGTNYTGGAIFRWDTSDGLVALIPITNLDVYSPQTGLMVGHDGALYGTALGGGNDYGAVVQVTTNGELAAVASFQYTNGSDPWAGLVESPDGTFYGTTLQGGSNNCGTLYSIKADGTFKTLVHFDFENGAYPLGSMVAGDDGAFYGITSAGGANNGGNIYKFSTNGILTTLVSFDCTNIGSPVTGLTRGDDGSFYGIALFDPGASNLETIFRVSTNGDLKALTSFSGTNFFYPFSCLSLGVDGAFYGLTFAGGIYNTGTVFRVTTNGDFTTLVSFDGTNGANPETAMTLGNDGAFYGTTSMGGISNRGTIFRMTTNGDLTSLISFGATEAFGYPSGGLVPDGHGAFYGDAGQLFRVTTNGSLTALTPNIYESVLGNLIHAGDNWYYGTTGFWSGSKQGGSIFRMNPSVQMLPLTHTTTAWTVNFNGIPGDSYQVLRATNLPGPWKALTNVTADSNGNGQYHDLHPPSDNAFYRIDMP